MSNRSISKWYDPILFEIVFPLLAFSIKMLFLSYRYIRIVGLEEKAEALSRSGGRAIYSCWHQRIVPGVNQLMNRGVTAMVSQSRDGEYAARFLGLLGLKDVRGSSTRGGSAALNELTRKIIEGRSGGMVVDGPLGPPRKAKMGAVIMARDTQVPIIPFAFGTDRCWVFNSWDRFMIPKPFAKIVFSYAEPIWVPTSAEGKDLETYRQLLEDRLNQANRDCDEQFGQERPWRK